MSGPLEINGLDEFREFIDEITDDTSQYCLEELIKNIKVALMMDIMMQTMKNSPVDTGRTRANWWISTWQPSEEMLWDHYDHTQTIQVNKNELATVERGEHMSIWMVNNVHYAIQLETGTAWYGFSPKAPNGMLLFSLIGGRLASGREVSGVLHRWARTRF